MFFLVLDVFFVNPRAQARGKDQHDTDLRKQLQFCLFVSVQSYGL